MLWRRLRSMRASGVALNSARGVHASSVLVGGGALAATLMAVSGAMYRISKTWLGRKEAAKWWMVERRRRRVSRQLVLILPFPQDMHIGKLWGESGAGQFLGLGFYWPWYPLAVGLLFLAAIVSGLYLTGFRRRFYTLVGRVPETSMAKI